MWQRLNWAARIAIIFGILGGFAFLITALVIFLRSGDWPAKYISAGVSLLAVTFIAIRRRTHQQQ
jgi:Na+/H+ antiporter NhaC